MTTQATEFLSTMVAHSARSFLSQLKPIKPFVLIAARGEFALVNAYYTWSESRYKYVASMRFDQPVSCVASNDEYVYVGLYEGNVHCILETDMKKSFRKRAFHNFNVGRHRILVLTAAQDKLSTSRFIYR